MAARPNKNGWQQCTATAKHTGNRCGQPAVRGRKTCRYHGGKSLAGPASPRFRTGRYSKYTRGRLQENYAEALQDETPYAMLDELALVDARVGELIGGLSTEASGKLWQQVKTNWRYFTAALRSKNSERQLELIPILDDLIHRGAAEWAMWYDIINLIEQRRRIVDSANRATQQRETAIPVEIVLLYIDKLAIAARTAVIEYAPEDAAGRIVAAISESYAEVVGTRPDSESGAVVIDADDDVFAQR